MRNVENRDRNGIIFMSSLLNTSKYSWNAVEGILGGLVDWHVVVL